MLRTPGTSILSVLALIDRDRDTQEQLAELLDAVAVSWSAGTPTRTLDYLHRVDRAPDAVAILVLDEPTLVLRSSHDEGPFGLWQAQVMELSSTRELAVEVSAVVARG